MPVWILAPGRQKAFETSAQLRARLAIMYVGLMYATKVGSGNTDFADWVTGIGSEVSRRRAKQQPFVLMVCLCNNGSHVAMPHLCIKRLRSEVLLLWR